MSQESRDTIAPDLDTAGPQPISDTNTGSSPGLTLGERVNIEGHRQTLSYIIIAIFVGFIVIIFALFISNKIDFNQTKELLGIMLGIFSGFIGMIVGYYFAKKTS